LPKREMKKHFFIPLLLLVASTCASSNDYRDIIGERYNEFYDRQIASSGVAPIAGFKNEDLDIDYLLRAQLRIDDRQRQGRQQQQQQQEEEEADGREAQEAKFPELSGEQRKFGVNPAFKTYYDSTFKREEGIDPPGNDEVSDPVMSAASDFHHPKKASYGDSMRYSVSAHQVDSDRMDDIFFTTIVAISSALAVFGIVGAGFCYHRVRRNSKASEDVEYPAYGVTGPKGAGGKDISPTSGTDRKLAQNAQMYHYQHQKQQMIAFDSASGGASDKRGHGVNGVGSGAAGSDCESDDGEEGDYTVYECPGLAPAGEMEVHNPLFQDDPTPKGGK
jgi:hypothetical protein